MVGGMVSATILTLLVIPAIYSLWQEAALRAEGRRATLVVAAVVPTGPEAALDGT
jgi:Cu(I)/Ag(I) efflux system membrane protein CusA/SilA